MSLETIAQRVAYEQMIAEVRIRTERSEIVSRRGVDRMMEMSRSRLVSVQDIFSEWRRRSISLSWGRVGRLSRLGLMERQHDQNS